MSDKFIWDGKLKGFGLRERNGRAAYVVQYRVGHKQRRLKIGDAAKLTEAKAREQARKLLAKVALGDDPAGDKQQGREANRHTFRQVAAEYLAGKKTSVRGPTYRELVRYLGVDPDASSDEARRRKRDLIGYWIALHALPINAIGRRDVAAVLTRIARENGRTSADRARSTLSAFFVWAMGEGIADQNPVIGTNKQAPSAPRDRVLDGIIREGDEAKLDQLPELRAVWDAAGDDAYGRIVRLLILTGCRREEIGGLRWGEIDFKTHTIHLPAERCKNHHPHDIPLSEFAWTLLPERTGDAEHVFGAFGSFTAWSRHKAALDQRLGDAVALWRLHDLRRTVATRLADLGVLPHVRLRLTIRAVLSGGSPASTTGADTSGRSAPRCCFGRTTSTQSSALPLGSQMPSAFRSLLLPAAALDFAGANALKWPELLFTIVLCGIRLRPELLTVVSLTLASLGVSGSFRSECVCGHEKYEASRGDDRRGQCWIQQKD
jgi:integrase